MKHGTVIREWADGKHTFRLAIGEWRELQTKTGVGPLTLFKRVLAGDWMVGDVYEVIRIGLIGGGMDPIKAMVLCDRYIGELEVALLAHIPVVLKILEAGLSVPKGEISKKAKAARTRETTTESSPSLQSSGAEP